jgi:hypothetical protein
MTTLRANQEEVRRKIMYKLQNPLWTDVKSFCASMNAPQTKAGFRPERRSTEW